MAEYREVSCSDCSGTGKRTCSRCNGKGKVYGRVEWNRLFTCIQCGGSGVMTCSNCGGWGSVRVDDE